MRFLIFLGLLILLYYLVKGWISPSKARQMGRGKGEWELESEMVKDPHCQTYIPKNSAIYARIDGREYYFCSRQCVKKFKRQIGENPHGREEE
jgi:YHS domain-containing protein